MNKRHTLPCLLMGLLTMLGTMSVAVAQSTADQWTRYKQKDAKGLNLDASAILDSLEATALRTHDTLQLFHVHYERAILLNSYSQSHEKAAIFFTDSVLQHSAAPYRNLYEMMLGHYLDEYHQLNYIKIIQRKVAADTTLSHLDEWTTKMCQEAIARHQKASRLHGEILKRYPLQDFLFLFPDSLPAYKYENATLHDLIFGIEIDTNSTYFKAVRYYEMAVKSNKDNDWMIQAHTLFTQLLESPKSLERHNAAAYLKAIEQSYVKAFNGIQGDLYPAAKLLVPIEYRNIDTLYVTCFRKTQNVFRVPSSQRHPKRYVDYCLKHPKFRFDSMDWLSSKDFDSLRTERFVLPSQHNYYAQSTDLFLDSLGNGNYLIVFHDHPEIDTNSMLQGVEISICDKSIVYEGKFKRQKHYRMVDASSGAPVPKAKVAALYGGIKHTRHSDDNGVITLPYQDASLCIPEAKNSILCKTYDTQGRYRRNLSLIFYELEWRWSQRRADQRYTCIPFTDRTIYRPGQTVYFKAIIFKEHKRQVLANKELEVYIRKDNNIQRIDSMQLVTNAFGSVDSCFVLPENLTPGNYRLFVQDKHKALWKNQALWNLSFFKVEEYKRPTFELSMDTIKDTYTFGDTVNLWGKATYYSGVPVPGATARVHIQDLNDEWSATTNAAGYFHVAIPTALLPQTYQNPWKTVFADITVSDPSGETQTTQKSFLVGGDCLTLHLKTPIEHINALTDTLFPVSITLQNQDKANISDTFQVRVYRLDVPARQHFLFSHDKPSMPLYSAVEYQRYFPNYSFEKSECLPQKFPTKSTVWEQVTADTNFTLNVQNWATGRYKLVVRATDPHGKQMQDSTLFSVIGKEPFQQADIIHAALLNEIDSSFKAQGVLHYTIGCSTIPNANLYYHIIYDNQIVKQGHLVLTDTLLTDSVLVNISPKAVHGEAQIIAYTFYHNHLYTSKDVKEGPFEHKLWHDFFEDTKAPLQLQVEHMNDKLNPGDQETWSFTLTGEDSTKHPEAEVVAFMYDASLDPLTEKNWYLKHDLTIYDNNKAIIDKNFLKRKYEPLKTHAYKFRLAPEYLSNSKNITTQTKPLPHLSLWDGKLPNTRTFSIGFYDYQVNSSGTSGTSGTSVIKGRVTDQTGEPLAFTYVFLKTLDDRIVNMAMSDDKGYYSLFSVPSGIFNITADAQMSCKKNTTQTGVNIEENIVRFIDFTIDCSSEIAEVVISYEPPVFDADNTSSTVRGNRSSGDQVIIDGVRVRSTPGRSVTSALSSLEGVSSKDGEMSSAKGLLADTPGASANPEASAQVRQELLGTLLPRTDFAETAFFLPKLHTDEQGRITFQFKAPDQLTRWHFTALAHTKDQHITAFAQDVCTQRALMVMPNVPRFVREGDTLQFRSNILAMNHRPLHGDARLEMWDTVSQQHLSIANADQSFQCDDAGSALAAWTIAVPQGLRSLQYKLAAVGTMPGYTYSDGETRNIPVLPQVIDLNEAIPFHIAKDSSQRVPLTFTTNGTRTLHISTHPTWAIYQALPYVVKSRHESNDELMYQYVANTLAKRYLKQHPQLLQHAELDEETRELFDLHRMHKTLKRITQDLQTRQNSNGSWGWLYKSGSDHYITTRIVTHLGQLSFLIESTSLDPSGRQALHYLCKQEIEDYSRFVLDTNPNKEFYFGPSRIRFLYALSYYNDWQEEWLPQEQLDFYLEEAENHYKQSTLHDKAMIAIACQRLGRAASAEQWAEALRQQAVHDPYGLSWTELKSRQRGWHDIAINTEALLMELFFEALPDTTDAQHTTKEQTLAGITQWLLAQRTTNQWGCNSTNTAVCYALALLERPVDTLHDRAQQIIIRYGDKIIQHPDTMLCGTYELSSNKETAIRIENQSSDAVYGSVWLQYQQTLDSVKTFGNEDIQIIRTLYRRNYDDEQAPWEEIRTGDTLRVGDILTVRFVIENGRNMDYVNISDMRACTLEPTSQTSQWKSNGDLRWYESPRDNTTEFYITHLDRGTHVLEYTLKVTQVGTFRNGTATIESMLAPEFTAHSDSPKLKVCATE